MEIEALSVPERAKRDAEALGSCVQRKTASVMIWTEAMLAALQRGVKGGRWHSLIDKVYRYETLELGWEQVRRNAGAAGVDQMSVEKFMQNKEGYLAELAKQLRQRSYEPQAIKRVYIPKGRGGKQWRPLGIPAVKAG